MVDRAYIGAGSNLGDSRAILAAAWNALDALPGIMPVARASDYRTAPLGYIDQPDFINTCFAIDTTLAPHALLTALQAIESSFGRERSFPNAPRTLDLDLLLFAARTIRDARLTLPHPRLHERAFVLQPLAEIAPTLTIPGHGALAVLVERCRDQPIVKLAPLEASSAQ